MLHLQHQPWSSHHFLFITIHVHPLSWPGGQTACDLPTKRILKRSTEENREDDNASVIETRFKEYNKTTKPVSDFYKKDFNEIYYDIDGNDQIEKITNKIKQIL